MGYKPGAAIPVNRTNGAQVTDVRANVRRVTIDPPPTRLPRALRPFRHREYRFLVASMGVSLVASGMWAVGWSGR